MLVIAGGIILAVVLMFVALVALPFLPGILRVVAALVVSLVILAQMFGG